MSEDAPFRDYHGLSTCSHCIHTTCLFSTIHRSVVPHYLVAPRFCDIQVWRDFGPRDWVRRTETNVLPCSRYHCFFSGRIRSAVTQNTTVDGGGIPPNGPGQSLYFLYIRGATSWGNFSGYSGIDCASCLLTVRNTKTIKLIYPCHIIRYLDNPEHRETFEAAHSVVLAIFATHAAPGRQSPTTDDLISHLVPFYAESLIKVRLEYRERGLFVLIALQNSANGRLTADQLRLAYPSLVKGAASCSPPEDGPLSWFCIQLLIDKIIGLTSKPGSKAGSEELRRLRLTLLSVVPSISLPSPLLDRLLSAIGLLVRKESSEQERSILLAAMYEVIVSEVGDAEREFVMRWWFSLLEKLGHRETAGVKGPLSARL